MYIVPEEKYIAKGYWQPYSLGEELHRSAERHAERIAVVSGGRRVTYRELDRLVDEYAAGMIELGIRPGDRVLLQLPNRLEFVLAAFALFRFGGIPIMGLPASREADIAALCRLAEPVAYITTDKYGSTEYRSIVESLSHGHPYLKYLITDNGGIEGTIPLETLRKPNPVISWDPPRFTETAVLLLSGGTTGTPKLIPRRHTDYAYNARAASERCGLNEDSAYLVVLPVAHNFSLSSPGIIGTLINGGKVVLAESVGSDEAFELIEREKVTFTALVPALLNLWLEAREWEEADLSSLVFIEAGGAAVDPGMAARVEPVLGCKMVNVFGTAEGLICTTSLDDEESVICNTQGRPISPADEIRIVDADDRDVPRGEAGELIVRGPYTIQGYYRAPEANRHAVTEDGYYRTGDIARIVCGERIQVCGRIKEQINRAGEKIAPVEVETVLRTHPLITDAAVVGVKDDDLGERICAWIMTDGAEVSLAAVYAFFEASGVARFKYPDQLEQLDVWPVTSVGKVDKRKLSAMAEERYAGRKV